MKIKANGDSKKIAQAIMYSVQEGKDVNLVAIGAAAVNVAVKSLTNAISLATVNGYNLSFTTSYNMREIEGKEKTAIRFKVIVEKG